MAEITPPNPSDSWITAIGRPEFQFYDWAQAITEAVNNLAPLTGIGTPEGSVVSGPGRWYVDTGAAAGSGVYFKETGVGDTGWVLRS